MISGRRCDDAATYVVGFCSLKGLFPAPLFLSRLFCAVMDFGRVGSGHRGGSEREIGGTCSKFRELMPASLTTTISTPFLIVPQDENALRATKGS